MASLHTHNEARATLAADRRRRKRSAVLAVLSAAERGLTAREIAEAVGEPRPSRATRDVLRDLLLEGRAVRHGLRSRLYSKHGQSPR